MLATILHAKTVDRRAEAAPVESAAGIWSAGTGDG